MSTTCQPTPVLAITGKVPHAFLTEVLDVYGRSAYVRTADLEGTKPQLRLHYRDGRPYEYTPATAGTALTICRENIAVVVGSLAHATRQKPWREIRAAAIERYRLQLAARLRVAGPAVRAFVERAAPGETLVGAALVGAIVRPGQFRPTEESRLVLVIADPAGAFADGAVDVALGDRLAVASWQEGLGAKLGVPRLAFTVVRGQLAQSAGEPVALEAPAAPSPVERSDVSQTAMLEVLDRFIGGPHTTPYEDLVLRAVATRLVATAA